MEQRPDGTGSVDKRPDSPVGTKFQFRRITTQKRFIPQIDGLRFVAIASVVFFHIYSALERGAIPPR